MGASAAGSMSGPAHDHLEAFGRPAGHRPDLVQNGTSERLDLRRPGRVVGRHHQRFGGDTDRPHMSRQLGSDDLFPASENRPELGGTLRRDVTHHRIKGLAYAPRSVVAAATRVSRLHDARFFTSITIETSIP
jgi:hypothetical protein